MADTLLALDVGEKRIGIALADPRIKIALPYDTFEVDGTEVQRIGELIVREEVRCVVVGYPRNQSGEPTAQTDFVERFTAQLEVFDVPVVFQDESLTSVLAEQQLGASGKPYAKGDIDKVAASLILQDYLESH